MKLYCSFVRGGNQGFIFQNEQREKRSRPSQSPSSRISPNEEARIIEKQAQIVGANADANLEQVILHEEAVRLEQRRQNNFRTLVLEVQGLQDEFTTFFRNKNIQTNPIEYARLTDRMVQLAQDVNNGFGLGLDLGYIENVDIKVEGRGLLLSISAFVGDKLHDTYVGLRPDGTYERLVQERFEASVADAEVAQGRNPNEKLVYFDSRTNGSSEYNLASLVEGAGGTINSLQRRDMERFNLDRGGRVMPLTE